MSPHKLSYRTPGCIWTVCVLVRDLTIKTRGFDCLTLFMHKILSGLGYMKVSGRQFLSTSHANLKIELLQILTMQFATDWIQYSDTDIVNIRKHYKHFSVLCPSKLNSSSAALPLCPLLWSSHTQLLLLVLLSPFFLFALFMTWNTKGFSLYCRPSCFVCGVS